MVRLLEKKIPAGYVQKISPKFLPIAAAELPKDSNITTGDDPRKLLDFAAEIFVCEVVFLHLAQRRLDIRSQLLDVTQTLLIRRIRVYAFNLQVFKSKPKDLHRVRGV
jgi:hypothetical protein